MRGSRGYQPGAMEEITLEPAGDGLVALLDEAGRIVLYAPRGTRAKVLSWPEQFTGRQGKYTTVAETVGGFREILDGKHDALPEQAFYLAGTIADVVENAEKMG